MNASLEFDGANLSPTYRFLKGLPGRSYGLAIARRLGVPEEVLEDAAGRISDAERHLDTLLAAVERRERELLAREGILEGRASGLDALSARLATQSAEQDLREAELRRREREAEKLARKETKNYLLEARRRVEEAIGSVRAGADEATSREARRAVEEAIQAQTEALGPGAGGRGVRGRGAARRAGCRPAGPGRQWRDRADPGTPARREGRGRRRQHPDGGGAAGTDPGPRRRTPDLPTSAHSAHSAHSSPAEIDLRGMTGDEAETATLAAVDSAVLAERASLRIIHGMGTGVVRERVRKVLAADRRVSRYDFAPPNQGGRGATIAEFAA